MPIGVNIRATGSQSQGFRKRIMEDRYSMKYQLTSNQKRVKFVFVGVFDGHWGFEAAAYARKHLLDAIIENDLFWSKNDGDVEMAIRDGYVKTHNGMWKDSENWPKTSSGLPSTSGTTASVAFIMRGKIYTGHVGDSRIVLGYQDEENGEWKAKPLTRDHKPDSFEEKLRIKGCGGKVINKSGVSRVVWSRPRIGHKGPVLRSTSIDEIPFLDVARALGDFWSYNYEHNKFVVSPEPDVEVFNVDPSKHRCLIFGTGGLWDVLSADIVVSNVCGTEKHNIEMKSLEKQDWLNPSKNLVDKAILQWNKNSLKAKNTTVITLMLDPPVPPASQVLFEHTLQTVNMKCENKNNSKCAVGDPQVECAIGDNAVLPLFTRYPTNHHLTASHSVASTSKPYDDSCKMNNLPTGKRSLRTNSGGKIIKKQKLNKNSTTADVAAKYASNYSENEQLPREPWLLSPNKSIKSEKTKGCVVFGNSVKDCTKITTLSKIKTPLTGPITRILRPHKKK